MTEKLYPIFSSDIFINKPTKRGIIETVIGHLKHRYQVWHTRHRSVFNAMTHLMAASAAYVVEPLKISAIKIFMANKFLTETQT